MIKAAHVVGGVAVATLLLAGCGSSGDDDGKHDATPTATSNPSDSPAPGDLTGSYLAHTGKDALILSISGSKAVLAGQHSCTGLFSHDLLTLKCTDGNTDRTKGKVTESSNGKYLTVRWSGLADPDTFTRVASPKDLPSNLPSHLRIPDLQGAGGGKG